MAIRDTIKSSNFTDMPDNPPNPATPPGGGNARMIDVKGMIRAASAARQHRPARPPGQEVHLAPLQGEDGGADQPGGQEHRRQVPRDGRRRRAGPGRPDPGRIQARVQRALRPTSRPRRRRPTSRVQAGPGRRARGSAQGPREAEGAGRRAPQRGGREGARSSASRSSSASSTSRSSRSSRSGRSILAGERIPRASPELKQVEAVIRPIIARLVAAERERFAMAGGQSRETQLLEKRIEKLYAQISAMESALGRSRSSKVYSNQQIQNVLRQLGLTNEDKNAEKKKEMLKIVLDVEQGHPQGRRRAGREGHHAGESRGLRGGAEVRGTRGLPSRPPNPRNLPNRR